MLNHFVCHESLSVEKRFHSAGSGPRRDRKIKSPIESSVISVGNRGIKKAVSIEIFP